MSLSEIAKRSPEAVDKFAIEQILSIADNGVLKDASLCSAELRNYFSELPSARKLAEYVGQCLTSKFDKSGLVLQDLINEFGRRLDYKVENGLYQGTQSSVGFDGIWVSPEGHAIVVEVKTTDAYRISLDTIAEYRRKLAAAGKIGAEASILIVVGRQDTGELEAQVRGSRHAWDVRLISADALIKLAELKEESDDPETGSKIRGVLRPVEYTRLDALVDAMFTAAKDVEGSVETEISEISDLGEGSSESEGSGWKFTEPHLLENKRNQILRTVSAGVGGPLIKKTRALYWTADHKHRTVCTLSKRYTKRNAHPYWYAYHPQWDDFLAEAEKGLLTLGCMDQNFAFVIPRQRLLPLLDKLNTTETERTTYKHIHLGENAAGRYELLVPDRTFNLDLTPFITQLT